MVRNYQQARKNSGISLKDAAKHLGISATTLRNYENGQTSPNACTLIAMCNLYQCSDDLLLDIPCDHSDSPSLSNDELAIVEHYRSCNCQWKKTIAMTAQSCANSSKRNPNVLYLPPRDSRSTALA